MERTDRRQIPDLKKRLLKSGSSFSFFQVIRILNRIKQGETGRQPDDTSGYSCFNKIRIRPNLSMAFPVSAIEKIAENKSDKAFEVIVNFLNLYGTLSPLPAYYTEDLFDEERMDEQFIRDFLDIVNQRLYELCFLAWSKYRSMIQMVEMVNPEHEERLFCLGGFGIEKVREKIRDPYRLLRYTGLFGMPTRSAVGLETLLTDATGHRARIIQCVNRKSTIPRNQRFDLGVRHTTLSVDGYLGKEIADRFSEFRVSFGPLTDAVFRKFLPGTRLHTKIKELIRLYLNDALLFSIELIVKGLHIKTIVLDSPDKKWGTLGQDTWLFSSDRIETSSICFKG